MRRALETAREAGVDWWIMRLVVSDHIPDGLADILERWTFADTLAAHATLDVIEATRPDPPTKRPRP